MQNVETNLTAEQVEALRDIQAGTATKEDLEHLFPTWDLSKQTLAELRLQIIHELIEAEELYFARILLTNDTNDSAYKFACEKLARMVANGESAIEMSRYLHDITNFLMVRRGGDSYKEQHLTMCKILKKSLPLSKDGSRPELLIKANGAKLIEVDTKELRQLIDTLDGTADSVLEFITKQESRDMLSLITLIEQTYLVSMLIDDDKPILSTNLTFNQAMRFFPIMK